VCAMHRSCHQCTAEDMPQAACELTVDLREGGHEVALYRSLIMLSRSNGSLVALLRRSLDDPRHCGGMRPPHGPCAIATSIESGPGRA